MKVWEIKTHRHGGTLVNATNIRSAIAAFEKFNREYLRRTKQVATTQKDDINSCICLGEVANP